MFDSKNKNTTKEKEKMKKCIGLFGTCGNSTWREAFIKTYEEMGIAYFNPQVKNWTPECATVEAENLVEDSVILFPVTSETNGIGSLAEIGFSIIQAIKYDERTFIIMVQADIDAKIKEENPALAKESTRARALVRAHLAKLNLENVVIVEDFKTMLECSIEAY